MGKTAQERAACAEAILIKCRGRKVASLADAEMLNAIIHELAAEAEEHVRIIGAATEFAFKPRLGEIAKWFHDDPEWEERITLSWRGEDSWAILQSIFCWTTNGWSMEPSSSNRSDEFLASARFTLEEALAIVPGLLDQVEEKVVAHLVQRKAEIEARYPLEQRRVAEIDSGG